MAMTKLNADDPEKLRRFFSPGQVDQQIRQTIHFCWMMLPPDKKTVDGLEREFRMMVDRALRDFREDDERFRTPKS